MIVNTISTASQFIDEFSQYNRLDNFSEEGLIALFDYLDMLSDDIGEPLQLDVIGLCCEFSEFDIDDLKDSYDMLDGLTNEQAIERLQDYTTVIGVDKRTFIIQEF